MDMPIAREIVIDLYSTVTQTSRDRFIANGLVPISLQSLSHDSDPWAIASACIAYAAGDAFGAAHEFVEVRPEKIASALLGKKDWPYGGVSDDTTLSLLTVESLRESTPEAAALRYLDLLRAAQPQLRGLGPTTRYALGIPVSEKELHFIGESNGGMMRTALLGMLFNPAQDLAREQWITASVQATHFHPKAVQAALQLSALFSDAIAHGDLHALPSPSKGWTVPAGGISLDPIESYNAVLHVASQSSSVESAFLLACELGGDTDTVAALAGSLVALRLRENSGLFNIPWLMDVQWSEIPELHSALELLITRRAQWAL